MTIRYDNIRPASPEMTRALVVINLSFGNPWGRQKSMARGMLMIGAQLNPDRKAELLAGARARYSDVIATVAQHRYNLAATILHLRFGRKFNPREWDQNRYLECLIVLRWLRRHNPQQYYALRDALTSTSAIVPRSK